MTNEQFCNEKQTVTLELTPAQIHWIESALFHEQQTYWDKAMKLKRKSDKELAEFMEKEYNKLHKLFSNEMSKLLNE